MVLSPLSASVKCSTAVGVHPLLSIRGPVPAIHAKNENEPRHDSGIWAMSISRARAFELMARGRGIRTDGIG